MADKNLVSALKILPYRTIQGMVKRLNLSTRDARVRSEIEFVLLRHFKTFANFEANLTIDEMDLFFRLVAESNDSEVLLNELVDSAPTLSRTAPPKRIKNDSLPRTTDEEGSVHGSLKQISNNHPFVAVVNSRNDSVTRLAELALGAGVAAIGASFGRDLYGVAKRNQLGLLVWASAGAIPLIVYAYYRDKDLNSSVPTWSRFVAGVGSGVWVCLLGIWWQVPQLQIIAIVAFILTFIAVLVARSKGIRANNLRKTALDLRIKNEEFLRELGIRGVGGKFHTYIDASGNELSLVDQRTDALVFKILGRRGVRAYIDVDAWGRMTKYRIQIT